MATVTGVSGPAATASWQPVLTGEDAVAAAERAALGTSARVVVWPPGNLKAACAATDEVLGALHRDALDVLSQAAAERRRARLDQVRVTVRTAANRFVAGQASAVVRWIEHGVPAPTAMPPRLSDRGLGGRPTLVQNVETLAHLALIARYGARWFRSVGTPAEPGSMLVTVAGGPAAPLQALLLGGYSGVWVDAAQAAGRPFSAAGLAGLSAEPGAGLIVALPAGACGLAETARVVRYLAGESAGQCGPCRFGLPGCG